MDIGETANIYKLIECNSFNGTGFYDHNIESVIQAINEFALGKFEGRIN